MNSQKISIWKSPFKTVLIGLCSFIWFLSFKPSEPYLSQFLICNELTQADDCQNSYFSPQDCDDAGICKWSSSSISCDLVPCSNFTLTECDSADSISSSYCVPSLSANGQVDSCVNSFCDKQFTEDQVNNDIYPWSTYAYLPFLCILGPLAELFSYRFAILIGISGRVMTRFLLIYGDSLLAMQFMQVVYSMGTAAEDVFSAYVYYMVPHVYYTDITSYVKASALLSCVLSGILGDILVTQFESSLSTLMIISAVCVCLGFLIGFFALRPMNIAVKNSTGFGFPYKPINNPKTSDPHKLVLLQEDIVDLDAPVISHSEAFKKSMHIFKQQLKCLQQTAITNYRLSALILYWVVGNAVFTVVYNYEVSIYEEIMGNNNWNGSVLSIMLLAGSMGALLPIYLRTGDISFARRSAYLSVAEITASISILLAILLWETFATIGLLTVFFAAWQFINVVCFAQLAIGLKEYSNSTSTSSLPQPVKSNSSEAEAEAATDGNINAINSDHPPSDEGGVPEPPYSVGIVSIIAVCVLLQIVIQSVLLSGLQFDLQDAMWIIALLFLAATGVHLIFTAVVVLTDTE